MEKWKSSKSKENKFLILLNLVKKELLNDVKTILRKHPRLAEERDPNGRCLLHYCVENSSALIAEYLIEVFPNLLTVQDNEGHTALHLSVISGNDNLTALLALKGDVNYLNCCDNEGHTAVHWATVCGELRCLRTLLANGANASTPDIQRAYPLHYAAQMCSPLSDICIEDGKIGLAVLNHLLQCDSVNVNCVDSDGRSPLLWAASTGAPDAILALVKSGANVASQDKDGLTALHCASSRGHLDCVETLLTLCSSEVELMDSNGCTPLFYAVTLGHADCTQLLLQSGADPNARDSKGRTPTHCGASKGQLETLKILAQHGADLWIRSGKGDLPLHEAIKSGRRELVKWLLDQIPSAINATNNVGRSCLHIAAIDNNVEMCKTLIDYGAEINTVMRIKGHFITPLDAALQKGYRGVAKYLLLHGASPASKISEFHSKKCLEHNLMDEFENENLVNEIQYFDDNNLVIQTKKETESHSTLPKLPSLVSKKELSLESSSSTASSIAADNKLKSIREIDTNLGEKVSSLRQAIITNVYVTNTTASRSKRVPPLKKSKKKKKPTSEGEQNLDVRGYTDSQASITIDSQISTIRSEENQENVDLGIERIEENVGKEGYHNEFEEKDDKMRDKEVKKENDKIDDRTKKELTQTEDNKNQEIPEAKDLVEKLTENAKLSEKVEKIEIEEEFNVLDEMRKHFQITDDGIRFVADYHDDCRLNFAGQTEEQAKGQTKDKVSEPEQSVLIDEKIEHSIEKEENDKTSFDLDEFAKDSNETVTKAVLEDNDKDNEVDEQKRRKREASKDEEKDFKLEEEENKKKSEVTARSEKRRMSKQLKIEDDFIEKEHSILDDKKDNGEDIQENLVDFLENIETRKKSLGAVEESTLVEMAEEKDHEKQSYHEEEQKNLIKEPEDLTFTNKETDYQEIKEVKEETEKQTNEIEDVKIIQQISENQDENEVTYKSDYEESSESVEDEIKSDDVSSAKVISKRETEDEINEISEDQKDESEKEQSLEKESIGGPETKEEEEKVLNVKEKSFEKTDEIEISDQIESNQLESDNLHEVEKIVDVSEEIQTKKSESSHSLSQDVPLSFTSQDSLFDATLLHDDNLNLKNTSDQKNSRQESSSAEKDVKKVHSSDKTVKSLQNKTDATSKTAISNHLTSQQKNGIKQKPKESKSVPDKSTRNHSSQATNPNHTQTSAPPQETPKPSPADSRCSHKLHFHKAPAHVGKVEVKHVKPKVHTRRTEGLRPTTKADFETRSYHEFEKVRYIRVRTGSDSFKSVDPSVITQTVEKSLRKYQLERKLFEELQDLKRFQIRSGRSNEALMVKRLVDKFRKEIKAPGMTDFRPPYNYKNYELYLYDQLRRLSSSNQGKVLPLIKSTSSENIESILKQSSDNLRKTEIIVERQAKSVTNSLIEDNRQKELYVEENLQPRGSSGPCKFDSQSKMSTEGDKNLEERTPSGKKLDTVDESDAKGHEITQPCEWIRMERLETSSITTTKIKSKDFRKGSEQRSQSEVFSKITEFSKSDQEKVHRQTLRRKCSKKNTETKSTKVTRPKLKRFKQSIPPKYKINLPLEEISKRWDAIKSSQRSKLNVRETCSSLSNNKCEFELWFELNKPEKVTYHEGYYRSIEFDKSNKPRTGKDLQRTLSDSALLMLQFSWIKT